jgi:hypothetical protein
MQLALPYVASSPRHNRDRLQLECVAPPPPRTTIDTDPHAPDAMLVRRGRPTHHAQPTIPLLPFDADVLITCPFAATILVAIRPSRSTPPLLHGESGAQRSRQPFLITGAALFGCERTTTSAARDGPQLSPHAPGCFANMPRTTPRADRPRSSCPPSLAPHSPPPRPPRPSPGLPLPPPLDTTACLYLGTSPTTRVRIACCLRSPPPAPASAPPRSARHDRTRRRRSAGLRRGRRRILRHCSGNTTHAHDHPHHHRQHLRQPFPVAYRVSFK